MTNNLIRKMGYCENFPAMLHDNLNGTASVSTKIEIAKKINFETFKSAWQILFNRHSILRALQFIHEREYYFSFTAKFSDIPIKHLVTDDIELINKEYHQDMLEIFDTTIYHWRSTLISSKVSETSYIIFAAPTEYVMEYHQAT